MTVLPVARLPQGMDGPVPAGFLTALCCLPCEVPLLILCNFGRGEPHTL